MVRGGRVMDWVCGVNADDGVVVVAAVVGICCGAVVSVGCGCGSAARRRRGEWKIMRSICRCVFRIRFSNSLVTVHASEPYRIVALTVP